MTAHTPATFSSSEQTAETRVAPAASLSSDPKSQALLRALATKDCLAEVLGRQGKREEARALLRNVLETRQTVLEQDPEHPDMCRTMNNLAGTLEPDNIAEAEMLFRQVFEADKKSKGYEHVYTIISMNNLAEILSRQGKYEEAEEMMRHTLKLSQIVRGPDHPETVALMDNLRELLGRQGKTTEAEQMLQQRPAFQQKASDRQKDTSEAERVCRGRLELSETDVERAAALRYLAGVLEAEGRYSEAESALQRSLTLLAATHNVRGQNLYSCKQSIGVVMSKQCKYKDAETIFQELLASDEAASG